MTQALNYCRQMVAQSELVLSRSDMPAGVKFAVNTAMDIAAAATKFVLPTDGFLIEDAELKALPDDALNLPYLNIVLEYAMSFAGHDAPPAGEINLSKRIVFARQEEDCITLVESAYWPEKDLWVTDRAFSIPRENYAKRDLADPRGKPLLTIMTGDWSDCSIPLERMVPHMSGTAWILLSFLNALACSNVEVQQADNPAADRYARLSPRKQARKLQPDTYHMLTVKLNATARKMGEGASDRNQVREHLRRGHIRRLVSGARIWVNSTIVMPGSTSGRVTKDYRVVASMVKGT
jgi:hypothetical protein